MEPPKKRTTKLRPTEEIQAITKIAEILRTLWKTTDIDQRVILQVEIQFLAGGKEDLIRAAEGYVSYFDWV